MRIVYLFLDGVGIGPDDADTNPFVTARLPFLDRRLGDRPFLDRPRLERRRASVFPLDATLGVEGLPQSGTGHASLLAGINGPRRFGRHFGPWVPVRLRPEVEDRSFLRRAVEDGRRVVFANAVPRRWAGASDRRITGHTLAARASGLLTRHEEAVARGEAVPSELGLDRWIRHTGQVELGPLPPRSAGHRVGGLAESADLVAFAHYDTDQVGHEGSLPEARSALERVDAFLAGVAESVPDDTLVLVVSDHGNLEAVGVGHTRNPALGILLGPGAPRRSAELGDLTDVAPALARWLGGTPDSRHPSEPSGPPGAGARAQSLPTG